jgi:hypothetical protein
VHLLRARWRRFVPGLAVIAVVVALLVWTLPYAGVAVSEDPMHRANPHSSALDVFKVGDRFTDDGVRLLGARLGRPNRRIGSWQMLHTWPPRHPKTDPRPLTTPITSRSVDPIKWELFTASTHSDLLST